MGKVSLELVARSAGSFGEDLNLVREKFPCIEILNIPDILKFDIRIPEACSIASGYFPNVIPHIRAVSIHRDEPFPLRDTFEKLGIKEVLVILGDNPEIISKSDEPCDSITLIKKLKEEMPRLTVYAGIDQWRSPIGQELEYASRKIAAGCDGFFTQPFFDMDLLSVYAEELKDTDVFWGLAPVVRESSKNYWQTKNGVIFPEEFKCNMKWNQDFARDVLGFAQSDRSHVYFCPITVDFVEYLKGIIPEENAGR